MYIIKIILRARQNYLCDKFRTETTQLSSGLIEQVKEAWGVYVRQKVSKGLLETDVNVLKEEGEEKAWPRLAERFLKDSAWKQECLKRDEKFSMHFSAAVRQFSSELKPVLTSSCIE